MTLGAILLAGAGAPRVQHALAPAPGNAEPTRHLCVQHLDRFELESGAVLRGVEHAYYLDGSLNEARDNMVVVFHALTGSANAVGDWWPGVAGPGLAIDTDRYADYNRIISDRRSICKYLCIIISLCDLPVR